MHDFNPSTRKGEAGGLCEFEDVFKVSVRDLEG